MATNKDYTCALTQIKNIQKACADLTKYVARLKPVIDKKVALKAAKRAGKVVTKTNKSGAGRPKGSPNKAKLSIVSSDKARKVA
jgi:hypothetical protein